MGTGIGSNKLATPSSGVPGGHGVSTTEAGEVSKGGVSSGPGRGPGDGGLFGGDKEHSWQMGVRNAEAAIACPREQKLRMLPFPSTQHALAQPASWQIGRAVSPIMWRIVL